MGNRRFSRKRLFEVEKRGQTVDLESGLGIASNVINATQHRQGQEIITEITMDLAASGNALLTGGDDTDLIGHATLPSFITQLTRAKYGIITEVRAVVTEVIQNAAADIGADGIDVVAGSGAAGIADGAAGTANGGATRTAMTHSVRRVGADASATQNTNALENQYLYLCVAEPATASNALATGKIVIYLHGFAVPSDL
jgi:hypothetical protein